MTEETLLIVEDNDILREGLLEMLAFEGFSVITARNGLDGLKEMESFTPALVLSDIAMPEMDGFEFLKSIRSRPEWVSIPFIFLTARVDEKDVLEGRNLGAEDYLTKPLSREELVSTVRSRLGRSRQLKVSQLQQAYLQSLEIFASAIDNRNPLTGDHSKNVADITIQLAKHIGWSGRRLSQLHYAAILHDIGRIYIPEAILGKKEMLADEEWDNIRQHPIISSLMIKDVAYLVDVVPFVRHHHENWDGTGYPDRLSGKTIPDGARIIRVADSLDAMTSPRYYKPKYPPAQAMDEIQTFSGIYYDPEVAKVLKTLWIAGKMLMPKS